MQCPFFKTSYFPDANGSSWWKNKKREAISGGDKITTEDGTYVTTEDGDHLTVQE